MGRPSHGRALSIWANGLRVGTWCIPARGEMELRYDRAWMHAELGRPLSLSLPFGVDDAPLRGPRVRHYFDNLLPDSETIRARIATRFRAASLDPFDLLMAIGRDCVGAVQLLAEDALPDGFDRIDGTPLTVERIVDLLARSLSPGPGDERADDFRISLAGAQEKIGLLHHDGKWQVPHGATPTTHILKLPLGLVGNKRADWTTSVENEWLCLRIFRAFGLPVPNAEILTFGGQKVLAVERFDRRLHASGKWIVRLPHEDFCQALGVPPHLKYEFDGGPGVADLAAVLRHSQRAARDLETLFAAQVLFWMMAAPDGHAKNFSLSIQRGGLYELAPLYDIMSIWPVEGDGESQWSWHKAKLAMSLAGRHRHVQMKEIRRRHFNATFMSCQPGYDAQSLIDRLLAATPRVLDDVAADLPLGFPARIAERIMGGIAASARRLQEMPDD